MFLKVQSSNNIDVEIVEVCFEKGKYIRRPDDTNYLHAHKDDTLVDWADSSHTLNKSFEFTVEPKTHVIRTHDNQCLIWEVEFGSLVQAPGTHPRAVTLAPDPKKLERTFAKSFENIGKKLQTQAFKRFCLFMEAAIPDEIKTKKDKKDFLDTVWKSMNSQEKEEWI